MKTTVVIENKLILSAEMDGDGEFSGTTTVQVVGGLTIEVDTCELWNAVQLLVGNEVPREGDGE